MRLPGVRFTVRRLMVATAVVGVVVWGIQMRQVAATYRHRAKVCEGRLVLELRLCGLYVADPRLDADAQEEARRVHYDLSYRWCLYFQSLSEMYKRAACYPWLPVPPEPPEPTRTD